MEPAPNTTLEVLIVPQRHCFERRKIDAANRLADAIGNYDGRSVER